MPGDAKRKPLKSVARSMADSFTSLMNYRDDDYVMEHIATQARQTGRTRLDADLLSGPLEPDEFVRPPIADSVAGYSHWFPQLVQSSGSDIASVRAARLSLVFDLGIRSGHYVCQVVIEDDRGKTYEAEISGNWASSGLP